MGVYLFFIVFSTRLLEAAKSKHFFFAHKIFTRSECRIWRERKRLEKLLNVAVSCYLSFPVRVVGRGRL